MYKVIVRNLILVNKQVYICDVIFGIVGINVMCGINKFNVIYISNVSKKMQFFYFVNF